jgi:hypothetical protein
MTVALDDRARREIARRDRRGQDTTLLVRVGRIGVQEHLAIGWAPPCLEQRGAACRVAVEGVVVWLDDRVARYARGHAITLSAWRLGPFAQLMIADEPAVLCALQDWEWRRWVAGRG